MTERWVKIAGHERYIVSDAGRARMGRVNAPVLRGYVDADGYRRVKIDRREYRLHRLVCEAFHGKAPPGTVCAHADGNPLNNAATNLRWATAAENTADAVRHGTFYTPVTPTRERHPNAKLSDEAVRYLRSLAAEGASQRSLARQFGISQPHVCRILNGQKRPKDIAQGGPA